MITIRTIQAVAAAILLTAWCGCDSGTDADTDNKNAELEELIGRHMIGEAMLAAHFVAAAERSGMSTDEINTVLRDVAAKSAIEEFWITDSLGHAYLTNTGVDFTFSPDSTVQPQAYVFWALLTGEESIVVQEARVREIDNRAFKYVGVAGVDKPRIVQVGVSAEHLLEKR